MPMLAYSAGLGLIVNLYLHPYFVYISTEGYGESEHIQTCAGPCSAVGNMSGYRCMSDCRSRGCEFDRPGPILSWRLIMK